MPNFGLRASIGFLVAGLAGLLSWGSYEQAPSRGGRYFVLWGAVLWGIYYGVRNLHAYWRVQNLVGQMQASAFDALRGEDPRWTVAASFTQFALLVAEADGAVSDSELEAIIQFFRVHGADEESLSQIRVLIVRLTSQPEVDEAISTISQECEEAKITIAAGLLEVACADGRLEQSELEIIVGLLIRVGFSEERAVEILEHLVPQERDERSSALHVLKLDENATEDQIKTAYHHMAQKYHPDKVTHLGPEFTDVAEQRFKEIKAAYETLSGK